MTVFVCKECVFLCNYESDYKRHINTKKHIKNIKTMNDNSTINNSKCITTKLNKKKSYKSNYTHDRYEEEALSRACASVTSNIVDQSVTPIKEIDVDINQCECGKLFKSSSGLRKHKRNLCSTKDNIIIKLIKDNAEMKELMREQQKFMREQQEQYHKQLVEMIPMVCATNNTNLITNNHNHMNIKQKFNLNVFLNEHCKDALNIGDFIKSLQITLDDLSVTREKNLEDSVENIFLRGLKELDIYRRPIHCTDHKRDVMYIKDEEKWEKDEGNIKLKGSIDAISRKQITKLKEWKDSDPEVTKTTSDKNGNFLLTMNHVCTPIPQTSQKRIIKNIGKEVQID